MTSATERRPFFMGRCRDCGGPTMPIVQKKILAFGFNRPDKIRPGEKLFCSDGTRTLEVREGSDPARFSDDGGKTFKRSPPIFYWIEQPGFAISWKHPDAIALASGATA